jgi:hypothetical protein
MSPIVVSVFISAGGLILSVSSAMFISGMHWGEMRSDMRAMALRLAKIEGMFTLKLKDKD